jgi:hypothetical protein
MNLQGLVMRAVEQWRNRIRYSSVRISLIDDILTINNSVGAPMSGLLSPLFGSSQNLNIPRNRRELLNCKRFYWGSCNPPAPAEENKTESSSHPTANLKRVLLRRQPSRE